MRGVQPVSASVSVTPPPASPTAAASLPVPTPPAAAFRANFAWLVRLRFGAVLGQLAVILAVSLGLGTALPLGALGALLGLELLLNVWAIALLRRGGPITEQQVTLGVSLDLLLFSALLYFSGGPANPFSFLYLIHIALAALVLPPRTSYLLVLSALACSLGLFWLHVPLPHDHSQHQHEYSWHMRGMWVAFGLAAVFIVYFIQRVLRELREIEEQLLASRERATRGDAVAALAMLSAGAAHELASPLSTIALASGELLRHLPETAASAREDVTLIKTQVDRCRAILDQLAAEAGQAQGSGFGELTWRLILDSSLVGLDRTRLAISMPSEEPSSLSGSLGAVSQALRNLLSNALEASEPSGLVRLSVAQTNGELTLRVEDDGPGMPASVLARAAEPFFTTKPRGRGMGLGLFLAQSVAEQMGGRLELSSSLGKGTVAVLVLPTRATISRMPGASARPHTARPYG